MDLSHCSIICKENTSYGMTRTTSTPNAYTTTTTTTTTDWEEFSPNTVYCLQANLAYETAICSRRHVREPNQAASQMPPMFDGGRLGKLERFRKRFEVRMYAEDLLASTAAEHAKPWRIAWLLSGPQLNLMECGAF